MIAGGSSSTPHADADETLPPAPPPIAIVGIGCRYPGARGPEALWRIIREERCTVEEVPEHRVALGYSVDRYYDPRLRIPGRISSCKAGFIHHPEQFDPLPFGLTPRDAAAMEPQARMMLEVVWDAIEDAGVKFESLRGERVAVMVGHTAEDFSRERIAVLGEDAAMRGLDVRTAVGFARAAISGRISHQLDLRGPSLTLDTACSSSLYATHLACQSIWSGESKLALAGGVNLFLTPEGSLALSRSGMMAPDGKCKAFDARADGFVRAEGAGVVLLRPLRDALANNDSIYALIRGTGVSADGRDGGHMMAPGRSGQAQAMHDAYRMADFAPSQVDFVEAHGTGTTIGDPVEIAALGDVMSPGRPDDRPLRVSSIKGNIGHSESASGVAGLIKAALAIKHRTLPAQLHFETPNPQIDWQALPIEVQTDTAAWPHEAIARAGVNSFGISGTNAHVALESAPTECESAQPKPGATMLLPITAHEPAALNDLAKLHLEQLRGSSGDDAVSLRDIGYSLAHRQSFHSHRIAVVADSAESLALELEQLLAGAPSAGCLRGRAAAGESERLVFVFPGQGGQWVGMGRALLDADPEFLRSIESFDRLYRKHVEWSLLEVLRDPRESGGPLQRLSILQPTLVALQVALADSLAHRGVKPDAVLGQSVGEVAAAAVAGILDREDVARLACHRGIAVERAAGKGAMGLVALSENETREALASGDGRVEIAGLNGPTSTLVAGDRGSLLSLIKRLEARGVFARTLNVDFASHCFHMDPLLDSFARSVGEVSPRENSVPFYSTVWGRVANGCELDTRYWMQNLRQPVRFSDAMQAALVEKQACFIELSPHPTLRKNIDEIAADCEKSAGYRESLRKGQPDEVSMLRLLGSLFVVGQPVQIERLHPVGNNVPLPLYPYQKKTLWFGERRRRDLRSPSHPLLAKCIVNAVDSRKRQWETILDLDTTPAFALSERDPFALLPASFFVEIAVAIASETWPERVVQVEKIRFETITSLGLEKGPAAMGSALRLDVQARLKVAGSARGELQLYARRIATASDCNSPDQWHRVGGATLVAQPAADERTTRCEESLDSIRARCEEVTTSFAKKELEFAGASFSRKLDSLRELHVGNSELLARIELPISCQNDVGHYALHPTLLEMGIAIAGCLLKPVDGGAFAKSIVHCRVEAQSSECAFVHAAALKDSLDVDLKFLDREGVVIATLEGLTTRAGDRVRANSELRFRHRLTWLPVDEDENLLTPQVVQMKESVGSPESVESEEPFAAAFEDVGSCDREVVLRARTSTRPGRGEVKLSVRAATLCQLDLHTLFSLDRLTAQHASPPRPEGPGYECSGVIIDVGQDVEKFRVGDVVTGIAHNAIASEVITRADWVVGVPGPFCVTQAATLPVAFMTAERALIDIARIAPGERSLILGGGGGVGLAATRVAVRAGARVFAAASGQARQDALRKCGAEKVFDSHDPELFAAVETWTDGRGADVVLSSLDDHRLESALAGLAPGGRFVDLRRASTRQHHDMPVRSGNRSIAYFDFDAWLAEEPETVGRALERAIESFAKKSEPTLPMTRFPIGELSRAVRFAAQNRNVGRVVIEFSSRAELSIKPALTPRRFARETSCWISGPDPEQIEFHAGWLEARGARKFVLHGTRPMDASLERVLGNIQGRGLEAHLSELPPQKTFLRANHDAAAFGCVVHVVGVDLPDATQVEIEFERMRSITSWAVANPAAVVRILHCSDDIFSSASDRTSDRDLRAYADSLCQEGKRAGANLASIAIANPHKPGRGERLRIAAALERLAIESPTSDCILIASDPDTWPADDPPGTSLVRRAVQVNADAGHATACAALASLPKDDRRARIKEVLLECIANVLALDGESRSQLDVDAPLVELGLDSLLARELAGVLERDLGFGPAPTVWVERPSSISLLDALEGMTPTGATSP